MSISVPVTKTECKARIAVIIAHYAPEPKFREVLKETIGRIRAQDFEGRVEVAVTDDGSQWSRDLVQPDEMHRVFDARQIRGTSELADLDVEWYIAGCDSDRYRKAELWNLAVQLTTADNLVFLDDDQAFASADALRLYNLYLQHYAFVVGRIVMPGEIYRTYYDTMVQGANFGMSRALLDRVGGFTPRASDWGRGEDSEVFWKVYRALSTTGAGERKACYAGDIITRDRCSGRWGQCVGGPEVFRKGFLELHGVDPLDNASRNKPGWMAHTSQFPFLMELGYTMRNTMWRLRTVFSSRATGG